MKLSENELRDVIKLLEEGKPLPDEYRFKLFDSGREVELVWNGKTNEVESAVLPFQHIEHIDEPRSEEDTKAQRELLDFSGQKTADWTNKLIWGDNKYILSSLKNGLLRQEIEDNGGIKLIYIDPPFDVGADFSMDIEVGGETLTKKPNVLEEIAYRDTWGKGTDSFIAMIYERLSLMHSLLADDGAIYVHCDWRLSAQLRLVLDEIFGQKNFLNEIIWNYEGTGSPSPLKLGSKHDTIFRYAKNRDAIKTNKMYFEQEINPKTYTSFFEDEKGAYRIQGLGDYSEQSIKKFDEQGRIYYSGKGTRYLKHYFNKKNGKYYKDKKLSDVWGDITQLGTSVQKEKVDYPTQKPEKLIKRIIEIETNNGDIVGDFFIGSGTTTAVAERLGRKWIGSDLGKFSIHTARKRMINVQRELKKVGKNYRAFEILNLGNYSEQQLPEKLPDKAKRNLEASRQQEFIDLILHAYKAERIITAHPFQGQKNNRMVMVGPMDLPGTFEAAEEAVKYANKQGITKVDFLAFEFEMGMAPFVQEEAKKRGVDLALKLIPPEVFDKRAVEKNQVKFHSAAYIEVKPHHKKRSVAIELTDFNVFYNQDVDESEMKSGSTRIVIRDGQVIKLHKNKDTDIVSEEVLTKKWTDWIDYWSVDFDFEDRKEIINDKWTGNYIFENEWQSFRTKKNRSIELKTVFREYTASGKYKIAIKVVDIFGNDTMKVIEVNV